MGRICQYSSRLRDISSRVLAHALAATHAVVVRSQDRGNNCDDEGHKRQDTKGDWVSPANVVGEVRHCGRGVLLMLGFLDACVLDGILRQATDRFLMRGERADGKEKLRRYDRPII